MSELFKYFREYDINYGNDNYSFLQEGGDYVMYKGGNIQMRVSVDKKKRVTTHLEDLNRQIKENKKRQVMLLYDVLYEQFHVEDMDFDDDELNEEDDNQEEKIELNNSVNKYNRNSILQIQQELSEELKKLEKERKIVNKFIEDNKRKQSILRRDILNDINLHTENLKIHEDEEERTKSYKEIIQNYNSLFELNNVGLLEMNNNPKLKFKNNNVGQNNRNENNAGSNRGTVIEGTGENEDNDSVVNLDDVELLNEEKITKLSNDVANNANNGNNNNNSINSFVSAKNTSDDESKEAEFDLE